MLKRSAIQVLNDMITFLYCYKLLVEKNIQVRYASKAIQYSLGVS